MCTSVCDCIATTAASSMISTATAKAAGATMRPEWAVGAVAGAVVAGGAFVGDL